MIKLNPDDFLNELTNTFGVKHEKDKWGYYWIKVDKDKLVELLKFLREKGFTQLITITAIDRPKEGMIELVYHLSYEGEKYFVFNISTAVPRDNPTIPSIYPIYNSAYLYEMEAYDLMGVKFEGHPNLTRILLPESLPEDIRPLRKDWKGNITEIIRSQKKEGE